MAATYFSKLPRVSYKFDVDGKKQEHDMANICIKYSLSYKEAKNATDLYKFYWPDNLRPDSFADKYYGSNELYWLALFSAGVYDIHNELPKNDTQLLEYIFKKYKTTDGFKLFLTEKYKNSGYTSQNHPDYNYPPSYKYSVASHAIMLEEQTNIDNMYYYASSTVHHYQDADGDFIDEKFKTNDGVEPKTILDFELDQNESKRLVNMIDNYYAPVFRSEFDNAMAELQAEMKNV